MQKLYFAHPVNSYDKPIEAAVGKLIQATLPEYDIESPNQQQHQDGYEEWKARTAKDRDNHGAMAYFYEVVMPKCIGTIAMPFLDGCMGLGVAGETKKSIERDELVLYLAPTPNIVLDNDQKVIHEAVEAFIKDPLNGLFCIRKFTDDQLLSILSEEAPFVIPHQETRLRTWHVYNKEMRLYEEAHLVSMPIPDGFYPEEK